MKRTHIILKRISTLTLALLLCLGMTACGDSSSSSGDSAATLTATYIGSPACETGIAERFTANYVETLETYSDGTYRLIFTCGALYEPEQAWGGYQISYYGTCTTESAEGVNTVTAEAPTRMTIAMSFPKTLTWDSASGAANVDGTEVAAETMLEAFAVSGQTFAIDDATGSFTYVDLGLDVMGISVLFASVAG